MKRLHRTMTRRQRGSKLLPNFALLVSTGLLFFLPGCDDGRIIDPPELYPTNAGHLQGIFYSVLLDERGETITAEVAVQINQVDDDPSTPATFLMQGGRAMEQVTLNGDPMTEIVLGSNTLYSTLVNSYDGSQFDIVIAFPEGFEHMETLLPGAFPQFVGVSPGATVTVEDSLQLRVDRWHGYSQLAVYWADTVEFLQTAQTATIHLPPDTDTLDVLLIASRLQRPELDNSWDDGLFHFPYPVPTYGDTAIAETRNLLYKRALTLVRTTPE